MPPDPAQSDAAQVTATLELAIFGETVRIKLTVPVGPASAATLLPIARNLSGHVVERITASLEQEGRSISCRKGCAACCRHLPSIAIAEARAIHRLVASMPEDRRSVIRARFAAANERMDQAGLLAMLVARDRKLPVSAEELGMRYFELQIACPFLEDELCTIHSDRPLACRHHLVTSPAAHCANPESGAVDGVTMPIKTSRALSLADPETSNDAQKLLPLTLALDWVDAHPEPEPVATGPELVEAFFEILTGRRLPPPRDAGSPPSLLDNAV